VQCLHEAENVNMKFVLLSEAVEPGKDVEKILYIVSFIVLFHFKTFVMDNLAYIEDSSTPRDEYPLESFEDFIVGVFVVVFDTKKGM